MTLKKGFSSWFATGIGCLGNDRNRIALSVQNLLVNRCFQVLQSFFDNIRNEKDKKEKVHSICKLVNGMHDYVFH